MSSTRYYCGRTTCMLDDRYTQRSRPHNDSQSRLLARSECMPLACRALENRQRTLGQSNAARGAYMYFRHLLCLAAPHTRTRCKRVSSFITDATDAKQRPHRELHEAGGAAWRL